jgi:hypothetical protein
MARERPPSGVLTILSDTVYRGKHYKYQRYRFCSRRFPSGVQRGRLRIFKREKVLAATYATASAALNFTLTNRLTPGSCMVTP